MSRNARKHMAAVSEREFSFVEAFEVARAAEVLQFKRFDGYGKWNGKIDYVAWLAWHAPLSGSSCVEVRECEACTRFVPVW